MDRKHVFADKLELVTGFVFHRTGVIAATVAGHLVSRGHQRRRGRRQAHEALYRPRHQRHARRHQQSPLGARRLGLRHARLQHGDGHVSRRARRASAATAAASSGSSRTAARSSSTAAAAATRGDSNITWDGQVFWTQPTSGTVFFHTLLPESVLAKGKLPGTTSWKGMIEKQPTYPLMTWPEQAYVQIDLVGQFTAAAGCAIYEGGAWPDKWRYAYFTGEPTLNIVHQQFVKPDGVSYTTQKEAGPRADGVHAQQGSLVPADRDARRARTARSTSSISTTRPSSTTTRAGRCTARPMPPFARIAITTSAGSTASSTSRRRSSTCRRSTGAISTA